jgi:ribosome-associated protein
MAKRNAPTDRRPKGEGLRPKSAGIRDQGSGIRDQGSGVRARASGVRTKTTGRRARSQGQFPKAVAGAVRAALDKKAEDVVVLDLRKAGGFTDFFVICTGANPRQITAIADGVRDTLKRELDERPTLMEGIDRSEWILLDYFNFVVHVFSRDCRAFYGLERLWGNAERHEISDETGVRA